ncbi:DinB family protein [Serinibacter arcticus]|uniref:DinB-like domain-containing protein n=1 Tax=Serinibacter arcticus TaxID=1655435 RepID=A0A4Z1E2X6_9MICO|nr:DinB family protein [Serinibacter arcticus]TGO05569.1 hypothetical protein SERN_1573 [Serinibacter arcticus]
MSEIAPDTKDWTWVLHEPCPECELDASTVAVADVGDLVRASVPRWTEALSCPDARERPDAGTWSVLEYGAHVRDVFRVFDGRLALVLEQDTPTFANWDQDATALADRYDQQDPAVVAEELAVAAGTIAVRFDGVPESAHPRRGRRSNGSEFTVTTLAQYFWHDVEHHLRDVGA